MPKIEKMRFATYLAVIKNSVDTRMFKEGYARIDGKPTNILKDGELSCAFYVSGILCLFDVKLIDYAHVTVGSTIKALEKSGWEKIGNAEQAKAGDIIVWESIKFPDGEEHEHIGFVVGDDEAISNDYVSGTPKKHTFKQTPDGVQREIEAIYRGRHLFESDK